MPQRPFSIRELRFGAPGESIYGKLYLPEGETRPRLMIYSHEIGCTHATAKPYAEHLASRGIAVFAPDFRGGGGHSRSDGDTVDMSVLTEVSDLGRVLTEAENWPEVDAGRVLLMGGSQGGMVSAIFAGRNPGRVEALIELYPGFNIPTDVKRTYPSPEEAPERAFFNGWIWMGRRYYYDMWDYDAFGEPMNYKGPVLILHGDADGIIDVSWSERAAAEYADAELRVLRGAGHMFSGKYVEEAIGYIDGFLVGHGLMEP